MPKAVAKHVDLTKQTSSGRLAKNFFEDTRSYFDIERESNFYILDYTAHIMFAFHCDRASKVFTWDVIYEFCEASLPKTPFALFQLRNWKPGQLVPRSDASASPGIYVLLNQDRSKLNFDCPGFPIGELIKNVSDTCAEQVRKRDKLCLISGTQVTAANKRNFTVVNMIPPDAHKLWKDLSLLELVTDPDAVMERDNKQTVQNAMLLRDDIAEAWIRGEITVDAKRGHAIMAFKKQWQFLHGRKLHLAHLRRRSELIPLYGCLEEHKLVSIVTRVVA